MKSNYQSKIIGLLFLAGGICILGNQFNIWDIPIFFPGWWTIFLILPALFSMVDDGIKFSNTCLLVIGGYFLLEANDWISFRLTLGSVVAMCCIIVGIRMIFGSQGERSRNTQQRSGDIHSSVSFASRRMDGTGIITSLDAQCTFGTQYIDLTKADLRNVDHISLQVSFGTIDLIVPTDMNYVVKKNCTLGSCDIQDNPLGRYDIYVDVSCIFGTVELRKKKNVEFHEGEFTEK